ncbi:hypothetical protein [Curtobacterium poinsettiae]|uniref:DUF3800 domain-containing protein n=1 Tax=Curtobacterium poinsettiae TaxID=159612 RepID=A0ABT3S0J6_9MICO|nr:hypothetical protein [Curtobacterium flaccumfaciens]MBT1608794.1 hypothetical protein [Curtobacterium flaccumfaciens pv. poinsettiae]MCX2848289.1 hypothetical protein [Curtobacterium flaccumfaciens pv. poinsettiae]UXN18883.1 hypothetical protein N8D78_01865 [Curtobacterium flaccumfaciens pv. poinsettiae]
MDESEPGDGRDPGAYILGAVTVADRDAERFRDSLCAIKPRSARKLHWSESDARHRTGIVGMLCDHPFEAIGVVSVTDRSVLESRGPSDRNDRAHLDALRSRKLVHGLVFEHLPGGREPLLWAADAVCGVVALARRGETPYLEQLDHVLSVHEHRR